MVPARAWQIAVGGGGGEVRERRAEGACADRDCGHRGCWIEEAHVTELTGILRGGRHDDIATWPQAMRIFARRERAAGRGSRSPLPGPGPMPSSPPGNASPPCLKPLTSTGTIPPAAKGTHRACGNPGDPAATGPQSCPDPKISIKPAAPPPSSYRPQSP
jgi:hypothetical protein